MVETDQQCAEEEIVEFSNIHLRIKMDLEDIKRLRIIIDINSDFDFLILVF